MSELGPEDCRIILEALARFEVEMEDNQNYSAAQQRDTLAAIDAAAQKVARLRRR